MPDGAESTPLSDDALWVSLVGFVLVPLLFWLVRRRLIQRVAEPMMVRSAEQRDEVIDELKPTRSTLRPHSSGDPRGRHVDTAFFRQRNETSSTGTAVKCIVGWIALGAASALLIAGLLQ